MDLGLGGKRALVFAASRGLGEASALALAAEGAHVAIVSRNEASLNAAVARLQAAVPNTTIKPYVCDVRKAEAVTETVAQATADLGGLDVLVCNAGGPPAGPFTELDDSAWQAAFELNLLSVVRMVRAALPHLNPGSSIVTITSGAVKEPIAGLGLSNVMRNGVLGLVKTLATELGPKGIRVINVAPGRIATDRIVELDDGIAAQSGVTGAEVRQRFESHIPLGRYGEPKEFGRIVCFVASPAASYLSGTTVLVDGGLIKALS